MDTFSELIRQATAGDQDARDELYRRYLRVVSLRVRDLLSPQLRRIDETMDIVHDVWIEVINRLPAFDDQGEAAFKNWLRTVAQRIVQSKGRRYRDRRGVTRVRNAETGQIDRVEKAETGPATGAAREDERAKMERCVARLRPNHQRVLRLVALGHGGLRTIAETLDLPSADAARKSYARALIALRREWKIDSNRR